jgi:hypothetical protein
VKLGRVVLLLGCAGCSRTIQVFAFDTSSMTFPGSEPVTTSGLPEPVCTEGSRWAPGVDAFSEVTDAWGLTDIAPDGVRMSAVDYDGDGWTDLVVRKSGADDFNEGGVRANWLLRNTGNGSFEDVTQASGLWAARNGTDPALGRDGSALVFGDVDNDGDLDVFTGIPDGVDGVEDSELMLNNGDGTFSLGPDTQDWRNHDDDNAYGVTFVDYDRDGELDLWTTHYYQQDRLFRGDGAGDFEEETYDVGLLTLDWLLVSELNAGRAHSSAWAGAACDLNRDGWPELLASSYGRAPNHLWQNDGGSFVNRSVDSGYAFDHRTDWSDNESARCFCKLHPDEEDCAGVPPPALTACNSDADILRWDHDYDREPFRLGGNSGTTVCEDVDNDGWTDLLTSEIVHWDVGSSSDPSELLFNAGTEDVTFTRPGNEVTGLVRTHTMVDWNDGDMTAGVFDFDNDGWSDVYIGSSDYLGSRGLLYHQTAPRQFVEVPLEDGIDHTRSHGVVAADFDRDGDLDVVVGHSSARCDYDCYDTFVVRMFENKVGDDGNWVALRLVGDDGSNRSAIGARVEVTADGVTQTRQVDGGHGIFGTQSDLVVHFGLGSACTATAKVTWPDAGGTEQTFDLVAGYRFVVHQGELPEVDP